MTAMQAPMADDRASLFGTRCAVVTGHHLATQGAWRALERGGSVVDAMLAASAVLAVALPHATSLGGCGMVLIHEAATGHTHALNGSGRAPLAATLACFGNAIDERGPRSWVVPGLVALWSEAHARFGRLPWSELFDDAIALARDGIGCSSEIARNLRVASAGLAGQPGFADLFHDAQGPLRAGARLRQPALAATLETLASEGAQGFYAGRTAEAMVQFARAVGGLLQAADLARATANWCEPVSGSFGDASDGQVGGGWLAQVMPPNSVGVLMLAQLAALGPLDGLPSRDALLCRQILAARRHLGAQQDEVANPARNWHAAGGVADDDPGDTAGIVIIDREGNALSMLQSVFQPFGSGCVDPATGVLFNNRLCEFSVDPSAHNALAPTRRPVHTLNPYLVFRDGRLVLAAASPGGVSQTTTGVQTIANACLLDMPLARAIDAPRWSLTRTGGFLAEPGFPDGVRPLLAASGVALQAGVTHPFYYGSVKAIRVHPDGVLEAAADLRRQAYALAA